MRDQRVLLDRFRYLAYVDLDQVDSNQKIELMSFIYNIVYYGIFESQIETSKLMAGVTGFSEPRLRETKAWFRKKFEAIMRSVHEADRKASTQWVPTDTDSGFVSHMVSDESGKMKPIPEWRAIDLFPDGSIESSWSISAVLEIKPQYKEKDGKSYVRHDPDWREKSRVRISSGLDWKTSLMVGFLKVINGLPPKAFRYCEGCDRWYFHITERERKYCSVKCTKKMLARRRRKRNNLTTRTV